MPKWDVIFQILQKHSDCSINFKDMISWPSLWMFCPLQSIIGTNFTAMKENGVFQTLFLLIELYSDYEFVIKYR